MPQYGKAQTTTIHRDRAKATHITHTPHCSLRLVYLLADYSYDAWHSLMKIDFTVWQTKHKTPHITLAPHTHTHITYV